ncbi:tetratricopeptide repeat protein 1 isoform X2 [Girardinichthys multiradiatus]|uniref:tetratricopeptide repeat protein 1 isoform X2 n=1 Tax=Girardinichthys multiradiatus TaxID=208333 RepID=UPI001FABBD15|nr:tetratricopeptide repeat protein 1 isoform X2 [Girardinichthys multiradiatus]
MSSRGGEQGGAGAAQQPGGPEEDEEDFFDCQESIETSNTTEDEQEERKEDGGDKREESQKDASGSDEFPPKIPDRISDSVDTERETRGGGQKEKDQQHGEKEQEEKEHQDQVDVLQDDSYSELKDEEASRGVEFDDDYLREVEKKLTEEEKESRRQQSVKLKEAGNSLFKAGDWKEAERSYTEALALCPVCFSRERAVLFSNRAAARLHLELKDEAISDCSRAIDLDPEYLRALLRRAELYEKTEKLDEALEDYKQVLERDPNNSGARRACMRLPQQIQERNEKLKEEMIGIMKQSTFSSLLSICAACFPGLQNEQTHGSELI